MIERGSWVPSSMPRRVRERAGRNVTHHDFERNDLDFANQLLAHVEPLDEMGRHPDVVEVLEYVFGNPVVEDALALDHLMFFRVERGRVVLEMLNQRSRLGSFVKNLRLAFIDAATAAHRDIPWLEKIHGNAVAPVQIKVRGGGKRAAPVKP